MLHEESGGIELLWIMEKNEKLEVMGCSTVNIYEVDEFRFPVSIVFLLLFFHVYHALSLH